MVRRNQWVRTNIVAVCAAGVLLALAASAPPVGAAPTTAAVRCRTMKGAVGPGTGTFQLGRCTDPTKTGHGGTATLTGSTTRGSTWDITWNTQQTTTIFFAARTTPSTVPGCASGTAIEVEQRGKVTADTTGAIPLGQKVSAVVCSRSVGRYRSISIPTGSTFDL